jgi:uncharacterized protein YndB with AHSA1/START domain
MNSTFIYTTYINTTPERLWSALTEPAFTRRYWGVSLISDWQVGSTVTWDMDRNVSVADPAQVVLAADPPRRLSYTWHTLTPEFLAAYPDEPSVSAKAAAERRSKVTFDLEPVGKLVKLTVTHDDFEPDSVILQGVSQGWPAIIASLKTLMETGEPLALAG